MLREEVVPGVSAQPGFHAGYWLEPKDGQVLAVVLFDSEEEARTASACGSYRQLLSGSAEFRRLLGLLPTPIDNRPRAVLRAITKKAADTIAPPNTYGTG